MSEYIYEHKPSGADHMGKPVEFPTLVQREEIVRCRDCVYLDADGYCTLLEFCHGDISDKFCAWAERKD